MAFATRTVPFRLVLASAVLLAAFPLGAQSSPPISPTVSEAERLTIGHLMSDLRNLVTMQEGHFAKTGAYALTVAGLGDAYRTTTGVTVEIVNGGTNAYAAASRFAGRAGNCVIFVGLGASTSPRTELEKKRFSEGEPACDGDGITEHAHWAAAAEHQAGSVLIAIAKLQERQFGRTGSYASDVGALMGYASQPNTVITIERMGEGNAASFLATATDARYPGSSCVLRSGWGRYGTRAATAAEKKRPTADLLPICDRFK